jgi:hypothetical protein
MKAKRMQMGGENEAKGTSSGMDVEKRVKGGAWEEEQRRGTRDENGR